MRGSCECAESGDGRGAESPPHRTLQTFRNSGWSEGVTGLFAPHAPEVVMRRSLLFAALFALGSAATARAADIPIDQVSLPAPSDRVHVKFPVGELRVEAATGNKVTLELTARC